MVYKQWYNHYEMSAILLNHGIVFLAAASNPGCTNYRNTAYSLTKNKIKKQIYTVKNFAEISQITKIPK